MKFILVVVVVIALLTGGLLWHAYTRSAEQESAMGARIALLEEQQAAAAARAAAPLIPASPAVVTQIWAMIPMPDGTVVTQLVETAVTSPIEGGSSSGALIQTMPLVMTQLLTVAKAMARQQENMGVLSQQVSEVATHLDGLSNSVTRELASQKESTERSFAQTRSDMGALGGRLGGLETNAVVLRAWLDGTFKATAEAGIPPTAGDLERRIRQTGETMSSLAADEARLRDAPDMVQSIKHYLVKRRLQRTEATLAELMNDWNQHVAPWVRVKKASNERLQALPQVAK